MQIAAIDRGALSALNERSLFFVAEALAYSSDFFWPKAILLWIEVAIASFPAEISSSRMEWILRSHLSSPPQGGKEELQSS